MSVDYYLVCHGCRQKIHVAQDGLSGWTFYSGERDCMKKLSAWLAAHALDKPDHRFVLHHEDMQSSEDYERIEWIGNHNAPADPRLAFADAAEGLLRRLIRQRPYGADSPLVAEARALLATLAKEP